MDEGKNTNCCAIEDCNRKLKLTDYACKCKKKFCKIHRLPEDHNCVYDYKENNNKQKKIEAMKCILDKIYKI
jgi:predicted nucleic acid binding AN1-type Zn finger protein